MTNSPLPSPANFSPPEVMLKPDEAYSRRYLISPDMVHQLVADVVSGVEASIPPTTLNNAARIVDSAAQNGKPAFISPKKLANSLGVNSDELTDIAAWLEGTGRLSTTPSKQGYQPIPVAQTLSPAAQEQSDQETPAKVRELIEQHLIATGKATEDNRWSAADEVLEQIALGISGADFISFENVGNNQHFDPATLELARRWLLVTRLIKPSLVGDGHQFRVDREGIMLAYGPEQQLPDPTRYRYPFLPF